MVTHVKKEDLVRLREEGLTIKEIAKELGIGSTTVVRWIKKFGLDSNKIERKFTDEELLELYEKYDTNTEIADILNVSTGLISLRLKKFNLKSKKGLKEREFHGLRYHPLYDVWCSMIQRTKNPNNKQYDDYGNRFINLCDEWRESFQAFYDFCMLNGWEEGLQIDREDNDKGYCPENCRIVTNRKNSLNQRLLQKNNKSGYEGIYWHSSHNNWQVSISVKDVQKFLGSYVKIRDAVKARNDYIIQHKLELEYKIQDIRNPSDENDYVKIRDNTFKQSIIRNDNTSGYVGISWLKKDKRWKAYMCINKKTIYISCHKEIEDAVEARNQYIIKNNLQDDYKIQEI